MKTTPASSSVLGPHSRVETLRHRERTTGDMVSAIEAKIARLTSARAERLTALKQIRSALAEAILAGHAETVAASYDRPPHSRQDSSESGAEVGRFYRQNDSMRP